MSYVMKVLNEFSMSALPMHSYRIPNLHSAIVKTQALKLVLGSTQLSFITLITIDCYSLNSIQARDPISQHWLSLESKRSP